MTQGRFLIGISCLLQVLSGRKTILISSDGFRWDYYGKFRTPALDKLRNRGVHVKNLENAFATVTFPNHYTLVTGLYEESHGIVDNDMFDPIFNEWFHMNTVDPKWWQGGEPIWVTANKSNIGSVCVNWVGCSVPVGNIRPTFWNPYDGNISFNDRVDTVVSRILSGETTGVDLGLLYFEEPDHSCHLHGPDSPQVADAISRVDEAIGRLLESVDLNEVNILFTSDHGGYTVSRDKLIILEDYISNDMQYFVSADGAVAHLWNLGDTNVESLLELLCAIPAENARCHRKEDIAWGLHYSKNRRIGPIVCIAELGWSIVKSHQEANSFTLKGSHGWDARRDENSPMRPLFLAAGPDIIQSPDILDPFANVHVFPLVHHLLGLDAGKSPMTNGTIEKVKHILNRPNHSSLEAYVVVQW